MQNALARLPFLRLLLPLLAGIVSQYFFCSQNWAFPFLFLGLVLMAFSFFIRPREHYKWRWLFGVGCYFFLFSIGLISTSLRQAQSAFTFPEAKAQYTGVVADIPQVKPKSIACNLQLNGSDKKIVCYLQPGIRSNKLTVGEEISFSGKIQPFKHFGNPNDFDYPRYMYNKGFAGTLYLYSDDWESTGRKPFSVLSFALQCRQSMLEFYQSLKLDDEEYAILSALTLGYKDVLSADLKQAFRATGTAHVLAVSGMHVGIIYGVILSLFALFVRSGKHYRTLQLPIIVLLWCYAFVTGFSPSVIRASIMLTIFCVATIFGRKGLSYNNISLAAFFMLLVNPFSLFDAGFQLSFAAVLSIRFFQPVLSGLLSPKNNYIRKGWELFTLSIAAQIGAFPVCLYYFGTFPSYFFITNLLVVPLVSVLFYGAICLSAAALIASALPAFSGYIYYLPVSFLKLVISLMTSLVRFFEQLPFALIEDIKLSFTDAALLIAVILSISLFLMHKQAKLFICALSFVLLICLLHLGESAVFKQNELTIYQKDKLPVIAWNTGMVSHTINSITTNKLIDLKGKRFLSLVSDEWDEKQTAERYPLDYLHIVNGNSISLYSLTQTFYIQSVIIDSSLSTKNRRRITKECEKLKIPYYDMSRKGIFRINF
ncbi:ComEC/Rec2 family competence protein [Viscerimonas tarda]